MEEAKPVRNLVPSLCGDILKRLPLVKHSCNGKCCISEEAMACDVLSLWWNTLLGETSGECFFQGYYPTLIFGST